MNRYEPIIDSMFEKQEELMKAFKPIERLPAWPVSLQSIGGQALMRDFIGRIGEELVEAYDALSQEATDEELVDTFHFLTELAIFAGVSNDTVIRRVGECDYREATSDVLERMYHRVHISLGRLRHEFKLRPWKVNPKPTNEQAIRQQIPVLFVQMFDIWHGHGRTIADLDRAFRNKYLVNMQRIMAKI